MIKYLEKEEKFDDEIKTGVVLVDFFATWCGPCKMLSPILEQYSSEEGEVKILKVDVDLHEEVARTYAIMTVPTLMVFKDGKEVKKHSGFSSLDKIKELIES